MQRQAGRLIGRLAAVSHDLSDNDSIVELSARFVDNLFEYQTKKNRTELSTSMTQTHAFVPKVRLSTAPFGVAKFPLHVELPNDYR